MIILFEVQWMARSVSPPHRRSQSEDMVLNPERVESDRINLLVVCCYNYYIPTVHVCL